MRTPPPELKLLSIKAGGLRWTVRSEAEAEVMKVCSAVEHHVSDPACHIKNSSNVTVARVSSAGGRGLIIRRMNYGRLGHQLRDFFRPSRARRAFFRGLALEQANVPTPRMLAVAEVRKFRWPLAAYLICDEVLDAQTLAAWVHHGCDNSREVAARLADAIARMHNAGFIHRDLKASNVLLDRELNPWLIDMDGLCFVSRVNVAAATADLAVLACALKYRPVGWRKLGATFLRHYCSHRRLNRRQLTGEILSRIGRS